MSRVSDRLNIEEAQLALNNKAQQLQQARDDYRDLQSKIKGDKKQLAESQAQVQRLDIALQEKLALWPSNPYLLNQEYHRESLQNLLNEQAVMTVQRRAIEALQKQLQSASLNLPALQESVQTLTLQVSNNTGIENRLIAEKNSAQEALQGLQQTYQQGVAQLEESQHTIKQHLPELIMQNSEQLSALFKQPDAWIDQQKAMYQNVIKYDEEQHNIDCKSS